jgi:terminase small subunit / prophage DNA-packing protein
MPTVNVTRVASALNLTEQRVQQLVHLGMPRESRGQYDPIKCAHWYIRYLQNAIEKRSAPALDGAFPGESRERIRLLRAAADLKEDRLAKERSQLVAVQDVEKAMTDLMRTTTAEIMAIPSRLAPQLVGETSRVMVHAKIEKACKESLAYLAKAGKDGDTQATSRSALRQEPIPEVAGTLAAD